MEGIAVEYVSTSIDPDINEKPKFYSYKINVNEQNAFDSHAHIFHLFNNI